MPIASTGWDVASAVLPFVLLIGFWMFLMRRIRAANPQEGIGEKLDEIRDELVRIRRALEQRNL